MYKGKSGMSRFTSQKKMSRFTGSSHTTRIWSIPHGFGRHFENGQFFLPHQFGQGFENFSFLSNKSSFYQNFTSF